MLYRDLAFFPTYNPPPTPSTGAMTFSSPMLAKNLIHSFIVACSSMSSANGIVQYLLDTRQQTAVGIGHLLQALLNATKPVAKPPIVVEHTNREGAVRRMLFSRQKLAATYSVSPGNIVVARL